MRVRAIVGHSGSGKTLLAERLVEALADKGQRVAYVKHAPHGFEPGRPGSDTWRLAQAGAASCHIVDGDGRLHTTQARAAGSPEAVLLSGVDADVVLLEGFSASAWPKIRVTCEGAAPREVAGAILCELAWDGTAFSAGQVRAAVEAVLGSDVVPGEATVWVQADGRDVPVRGFAARAVASTLLGLCSALHGVDRPRALTVGVDWPATPSTLASAEAPA